MAKRATWMDSNEASSLIAEERQEQKHKRAENGWGDEEEVDWSK